MNQVDPDRRRAGCGSRPIGTADTEDAESGWAEILLHICNNSGVCCSSPSAEDRHRRILLGNVTGGETWAVHLTGLVVPDSFDSNYHHLQDERVVYVSLYWEDMDRDDADGPATGIE